MPAHAAARHASLRGADGGGAFLDVFVDEAASAQRPGKKGVFSSRTLRAVARLRPTLRTLADAQRQPLRRLLRGSGKPKKKELSGLFAEKHRALAADYADLVCEPAWRARPVELSVVDDVEFEYVGEPESLAAVMASFVDALGAALAAPPDGADGIDDEAAGALATAFGAGGPSPPPPPPSPAPSPKTS